MAALRSPRGCRWDAEQTHDTLRPYLIEEAYEALEAINSGDDEALRGELGDVLLQCVFHAQIAAEGNRFAMKDVVDGLVAKLIRRHPHVFSPDGAPLRSSARARRTPPEAVLEQWTELKAREQKDAGRKARVLSGLPRALPALLRAHKIGARVATVGFDWPSAADVLDKIEEEIRELRAALAEGHSRAAEEMGDVLFSIANLARKLRIEPETALAAANDKFTHRFGLVEEHLERQGTDVHAASPADLEAAWDAIKEAPATPRVPRRSSTIARSRSARGSRVRRSRQ